MRWNVSTIGYIFLRVFWVSIFAVRLFCQGSTNGSMIGALRMLRLVRLFTFIKGVQQLRVIVSGLITGMKSVLYIVVLLFLVIYIFSIMVRKRLTKNRIIWHWPQCDQVFALHKS